MTAKAFETFRSLHEAGLLLLANAWDPGSARLIESLGAKAVATSSAGMAWAAGYADGNRLPVDLVVSISQRIAGIIRVPVSVDIEGGYSDDPAAVATLALRLAEVGVAGINIEDGTAPPDLLARKIEAIKAALHRAGLDLFVNARTDVYLAALVDGPDRVKEVGQRGRRYAAAGANGLFVPAVTVLAEIAEIARDSRLPLNVLAREALPGPAQLEAAGVRRLSAGSGVVAGVWGQAQALARQFLANGQLGANAMPYGEVQKLFL